MCVVVGGRCNTCKDVEEGGVHVKPVIPSAQLLTCRKCKLSFHGWGWTGVVNPLFAKTKTMCMQFLSKSAKKNV